MSSDRVLIRAAMVIDAQMVRAAPGAVFIEHGRLIAAGSPQAIGRPDDVRVVDLPSSVLVPGLVNAHAHLDLTHLGPVNYGGDFVNWIRFVRTGRAVDSVDIAASVRRGAALADTGGTALVGDIAGAGSLIPAQVLREVGMAGVSYVEVFGVGRSQGAAVERIRALCAEYGQADGPVRVGVQPHAPYSCGPQVYRAASSSGLPCATHLAETLDEELFTRRGEGAFADLLRSIGVWDDTMTPSGRHPVEHVAEALGEAPFVAAHLNYVDMEHLPMLARWGVHVVYCPRASTYFGHPVPGRAPHRYRDMLEAGVNVCLGTDSMLCLDTPERISVLDEMRLLHRRDGVDPRLLLRMATVNGAAALGFDPATVTLAVDASSARGEAGRRSVLAVEPPDGWIGDPLRGILMSNTSPTWILHPDRGLVI